MVDLVGKENQVDLVGKDQVNLAAAVVKAAGTSI
jgi:hypothetical protein